MQTTTSTAQAPVSQLESRSNITIDAVLNALYSQIRFLKRSTSMLPSRRTSLSTLRPLLRDSSSRRPAPAVGAWNHNWCAVATECAPSFAVNPQVHYLTLHLPIAGVGRKPPWCHLQCNGMVP